jgi:hypothetical protein
MKRRTATTGLLFFGVVIALAMMGLVYGSWAERINIGGQVETGNINIKPQVAGVFKSDLKGKKVADCEVKVGDENTQTKKTPIRVKIENGYPGFSCKIWLDLENKSTVPIETSGYIVNNTQGALQVAFSADTGDKGDCHDKQLNPGQNSKTWCDFTVYVTKLAKQETTYNFEIHALGELLNKPSDG